MTKAYTLTKSAATISKAFNLEGEVNYEANFNIQPTQLAPVIIQGKNLGLSFFYWGKTPGFAKRKALAEKLYIVRAESILETFVHNPARRQRRCLIPADGFYLWRQISKKGLVPYWYFIGEQNLFAFAGLWEEFTGLDGATVYTFSLISTVANDLVRQTSPRMPVILDSDSAQGWLKTSHDKAAALLTPYPAKRMHGFPVSAKVNNPVKNGPELIEPAPPADQFGNYSLFD